MVNKGCPGTFDTMLQLDLSSFVESDDLSKVLHDALVRVYLDVHVSSVN